MASGSHSFFGADTSGFGAGGPRTPLRGFGNSSTSSIFGVGQSSQNQNQQQNTPGNNQFSFGGSQQHQQQPISSSSAYPTETQSGMYQPISSGLPRTSSFRNLRRSTSNGAGFSGNPGHESSASKTVRWQDAPQQQTTMQTQPYLNFGTPQTQHLQSSQSGGYSIYTSSPFGQTYPSSSPFQQQRSFDNPTQPRTVDQFHNASENFSLQPTQTSHQSGSFALAPQASSSSAHSGSVVQTKSAFNSSLASLSRPLSISTSPARATVSKSASIAKQTFSTQTNNPSSIGSMPTKETVITPRSAIVNRIKWNLAALFLNWAIPRIQPMNLAYWYLLSATLSVFGGDSDVQLASVLSWLRNAFFIILLINLVEALIRLQTHQDIPSASTQVLNSATGPTARKPSLANPPNRQVSSSSSPSVNSNRISISSSGFKSSTPRHYAQDSPLRESINRASASATLQSKGDNLGDSSFTSSLGEGWRGPSHLPANLRQSRKGSSSPAAAYLARKQERKISGGGGTSGLGEYSFNGDLDGDGTVDFSQDSIDVNRAIRALSASYIREFSQGPLNGSESTREGVPV